MELQHRSGEKGSHVRPLCILRRHITASAAPNNRHYPGTVMHCTGDRRRDVRFVRCRRACEADTLHPTLLSAGTRDCDPSIWLCMCVRDSDNFHCFEGSMPTCNVCLETSQCRDVLPRRYKRGKGCDRGRPSARSSSSLRLHLSTSTFALHPPKAFNTTFLTTPPHLTTITMKFSAVASILALATAVFAAPAAEATPAPVAVSVSYDQVYDNASGDLHTVACSDGANGLLTKGKSPPTSTSNSKLIRTLM